MIERIVAIREKSSLLYYLVLALLIVPVIALIFLSFVSPLIRGWLVNSAEKLMNSSKAKDDELKKDVKDLQDQIDQQDAKDKELKEQLERVKNDDADWHKKTK